MDELFQVILLLLQKSVTSQWEVEHLLETWWCVLLVTSSSILFLSLYTVRCLFVRPLVNGLKLRSYNYNLKNFYLRLRNLRRKEKKKVNVNISVLSRLTLEKIFLVEQVVRKLKYLNSSDFGSTVSQFLDHLLFLSRLSVQVTNKVIRSDLINVLYNSIYSLHMEW